MRRCGDMLGVLVLVVLQTAACSGWILQSTTTIPPRQSQRRRRLFALHQTFASGQQRTVEEESYTIENEEDEESDYQTRFGGVGRLYSSNESSSSSSSAAAVLQRLQASSVVVIGLGGVGSWAAEALCRSGIGSIVLVDLDDICVSNVNRQLHAVSQSVGQLKIDVLHDRLRSINPTCQVQLVHDFVSTENVQEIFDTYLANVTAVLDCIDGAKEKAAIVAQCVRRRTPVVTVGGAAGRRNPSRILALDLTVADGDRLLAGTKRYLRKDHAFPAGLPFHKLRQAGGAGRVKKWRIAAVHSTEKVVEKESLSSKSSSLRLCDGALGTACFVTGTFGFVAAAAVVDGIATNTLRAPTVQRLQSTSSS